MTLTLAFLAALLVSLGLKLWLAARQIRHVNAHRSAVPPAFAEHVPLADHQKAADYTVARVRFGRVGAIVDTALIVALTLAGGIDALAALAAGWFASPLAQGVALIALVGLVSGLVGLPLAWLRTFGLEARFGFNRTTPAMFVADALKGAAVSAVIGLPLTALVLWLMGAAGDAWWLWAWLAWSGTSLALVVIYPTLIAPLFNKFTPLADPALAERINALMARTGFRAKGLFVMDGSRRSSHGNAYFTGFGAARRIVFFDTLLTQLTPAEVEAVLAHELGHFKRHHIVKRMLFTFGTSLGCLALLGQLVDAPWFYQGLGVGTPSHAAALLLFFMALPAFTFPLTPLASRMSRHHEYEADGFAARETRAADLVSALIKLYRDNAATLTPDPLHSAFYDSHPPAALRIAHLQQGSPR
ncbi:STE24 endopeptidase [Crenobacter luteus]|uniref:M48 family metallopeptidase n=1 Tax=Crenobacter luteus TaxID=1452487 RepID=UPI001048505E|nr:M48 family metallopeptidase [Crenobacter luteus]TCP09379.1 STE24 endopeptidase [Crenobacter luteus]